MGSCRKAHFTSRGNGFTEPQISCPRHRVSQTRDLSWMARKGRGSVSEVQRSVPALGLAPAPSAFCPGVGTELWATGVGKSLGRCRMWRLMRLASNSCHPTPLRGGVCQSARLTDMVRPSSPQSHTPRPASQASGGTDWPLEAGNVAKSGLQTPCRKPLGLGSALGACVGLCDGQTPATAVELPSGVGILPGARPMALATLYSSA